METKLKLTHKSAYGKDFFYPACDTSKGLAEFAGAKSFTKAQLQMLKKLGYELEIVAPQVEI